MQFSCKLHSCRLLQFFLLHTKQKLAKDDFQFQILGEALATVKMYVPYVIKEFSLEFQFVYISVL